MKGPEMKGPLGGEIHGTTILGARGQVVVPQEVRNKLKLKQNDKMLVLSYNGMVILASTAQFNSYITGYVKRINLIKNKIAKVKKASHRKGA